MYPFSTTFFWVCVWLRSFRIIKDCMFVYVPHKTGHKISLKGKISFFVGDYLLIYSFVWFDRNIMENKGVQCGGPPKKVSLKMNINYIMVLRRRGECFFAIPSHT
jgi:hypothetical protein